MMLIHSFIHLPTADTQIGDLKFLTEGIEKSIIWWAALHLPHAMRFEVFHSSVVEDSRLVGFCAMLTGNNWPVSKLGILPSLSESSVRRKPLNLCNVQCLQYIEPSLYFTVLPVCVYCLY
jgi:hypothetical protein